jgi:hypothetical protein
MSRSLTGYSYKHHVSYSLAHMLLHSDPLTVMLGFLTLLSCVVKVA